MVGIQKFGTWKLATKPPFFFLLLSGYRYYLHGTKSWKRLILPSQIITLCLVHNSPPFLFVSFKSFLTQMQVFKNFPTSTHAFTLSPLSELVSMDVICRMYYSRLPLAIKLIAN